MNAYRSGKQQQDQTSPNLVHALMLGPVHLKQGKVLITECSREGLKIVSIEVLRKNIKGNARKMKNCPKAGGPEGPTFSVIKRIR